MADPQTRIVSLTITEGGYNIDEASGAFRIDAADIRHDLAGEPPRTVWPLYDVSKDDPNVKFVQNGQPADITLRMRGVERIGYLLPFEIVSVHLTVVLIGAAYLARAKRRREASA